MPEKNMLSKEPLMQRLLCLPGKIVSWLIIPLILSIITSVVAARTGQSILIDWEGRLPVVGDALTVNSLVDAQWYIFSLLVLFGGTWALVDDRHVTVDFLAVRFSARTRAWITILGDLFLLLPLCILVARYGTSFAAIAWRTGEGSNQGGLIAHWLIKGALPISFTLLGLAAIVRSVQAFRAMRTNFSTETDVNHDR